MTLSLESKMSGLLMPLTQARQARAAVLIGLAAPALKKV